MFCICDLLLRFLWEVNSSSFSSPCDVFDDLCPASQHIGDPLWCLKLYMCSRPLKAVSFPIVGSSVNILWMNTACISLRIRHAWFNLGPFLFGRCAWIQPCSLSALCPGVVYQSGSEWPVASLEFQPRRKWNGFKLWTFDSDSVSTHEARLDHYQNSRGTLTAADLDFFFEGKCSVYCESLLHHPQNKRWEHVWVGQFLKNPLRLKGACVDSEVALWTSDWKTDVFGVEL